MFVLNRRLFTDASKTQILEDGDPQAAYLIGGKGTTLSDEDAENYGLNESHQLVEDEAEEVVDDAVVEDEEEVEVEDEDDATPAKPKAKATKKPAAKKK